MNNYLSLLVGHYFIYFNAHKVNLLMKNINGKDTKKEILEKKIDLDGANIFDEVNEGSDNEDLHLPKLLGKTHSLGDGKVFKATNKATVLKIDIPKNIQNLETVETNNGELAFGYDYTNVFANLLAKFNKYCCFKFFYNYVKKKNSRKWRSPKFTVKVKCMMEGCPDENTLEEKLTIQFDGDIYHKLGDVKARKIIYKERYNAYNSFQENTKLKPSTDSQKSLFNLNKTSFGAGHRSGVEKSMAAIQKISSKARKKSSSLEYISTEILKLQEYTIKDEEKQFNVTSSFRYIQSPFISHSGLHLSLFDEGLVKLYNLSAPVLTASGSFILPLSWIGNKDGKPKGILIYVLTSCSR